MSMVNRRNSSRRMMEMPVTKQMGDDERVYFVSDLSPSGVKIRRQGMGGYGQPLCNLELHLVPGAMSTVLTARRVWHDEDFEAFEFVAPSYAQQALLERMLDNY